MERLEALVEVLRCEERKLRARLPYMDLSELGLERMETLLRRFTISTEVDLAAARTDHFLLGSVIEVVEERIDDLRKMEDAHLAVSRSVRDADWLWEAMKEPGAVDPVSTNVLAPAAGEKQYVI